MSFRPPDAGDVFLLDRSGEFEDVSWVAIGRHSRNTSLVLMAPCIREAQRGGGNAVCDLKGNSWTLYPEVQLCVHEADLEDGDFVPSLKFYLTAADLKIKQNVVGEVEQEGHLDRLVQARDAIEHLLHFGPESETSKPALEECSLISINPEHREVKFCWKMDPNREYTAHAAISRDVEIQQTYRVDATSRDLQLPLIVGTEEIEFDEGGRSSVAPMLARLIEQQFGHPGLLVSKDTPTRHESGNKARVSWLTSVLGQPWFVPAGLAALAILVVSMSNYWTSPDVDTAEYIVVSASVQDASSAAAAGFRGADEMGGDIFTIRLESPAVDKTADHLTDEMTNLNSLVTRRAISARHVNLMVAMPSNPEDAAKVLELFEQGDRPPSALLMVEVVRSSASNER